VRSRDRSSSKGLFLVPRPPASTPKPDVAELAAEQKKVIAALLAELTEEYQPDGPTEMAMVQTMAAARWRANYSVQLHARAERSLEWEKLLSLERYQAANEKSFRMALKTLRTLQKTRPRPKLVKRKITDGY
jgi:hypothetical protein